MAGIPAATALVRGPMAGNCVERKAPQGLRFQAGFLQEIAEVTEELVRKASLLAPLTPVPINPASCVCTHAASPPCESVKSVSSEALVRHGFHGFSRREERFHAFGSGNRVDRKAPQGLRLQAGFLQEVAEVTEDLVRTASLLAPLPPVQINAASCVWTHADRLRGNRRNPCPRRASTAGPVRRTRPVA